MGRALAVGCSVCAYPASAAATIAARLWTAPRVRRGSALGRAAFAMGAAACTGLCAAAHSARAAAGAAAATRVRTRQRGATGTASARLRTASGPAPMGRTAAVLAGASGLSGSARPSASLVGRRTAAAVRAARWWSTLRTMGRGSRR